MTKMNPDGSYDTPRSGTPEDLERVVNSPKYKALCDALHEADEKEGWKHLVTIDPTKDDGSAEEEAPVYSEMEDEQEMRLARRKAIAAKMKLARKGKGSK